MRAGTQSTASSLASQSALPAGLGQGRLEKKLALCEDCAAPWQRKSHSPTEWPLPPGPLAAPACPALPCPGDPPSLYKWWLQMSEWVLCVVAARAVCGTLVSRKGAAAGSRGAGGWREADVTFAFGLSAECGADVCFLSWGGRCWTPWLSGNMQRCRARNRPSLHLLFVSFTRRHSRRSPHFTHPCTHCPPPTPSAPEQVVLLGPLLLGISRALDRAFAGHPTLLLFSVMIACPLCMNMVQVGGCCGGVGWDGSGVGAGLGPGGSCRAQRAAAARQALVGCAGAVCWVEGRKGPTTLCRAQP